MLSFFPNAYVRHLCKHVDLVKDMKKCVLCACHCMERLDERTCHLVETLLRLCIPNEQLCSTPDILNLATTLPGDHPGWRLLSVLVEHTGNDEQIPGPRIRAATEDLGRLKTRLTNGEFKTMRPFAVVVWLVCRLKMYIDPTDEVTFPVIWKDIMKTDVRSPNLVSSRHLKGTLVGSVDMIFGAHL